MEILVNISNAPLTNIKRKAKLREFKWRLEDGDEVFIIQCEILRFANVNGEYGSAIPISQENPSYRKDFTAIDTTRIDPETGDILSVEDISVGVGEYTATLFKMSQLYPGISPLDLVVGLIVQSIEIADQRGRFN